MNNKTAQREIEVKNMVLKARRKVKETQRTNLLKMADKLGEEIRQIDIQITYNTEQYYQLS